MLVAQILIAPLAALGVGFRVSVSVTAACALSVFRRFGMSLASGGV